MQNAVKQVNKNPIPFSQNITFNLQNGSEILEKHFGKVNRFDYEDSLSITKTSDLIDWIKTTASVTALSEEEADKLYDYFEGIRKRDGAINIPKECGLFVCVKS